jgi:hypothetical protein
MDVELAAPGDNRFTVRFSPPATIPSVAFTKGVIPYNGFVPKQAEVQLKPGANIVNIELKQGGKAGR